MFDVGEYVVYKRNVCIVKEIKDNYYVLIPLNDDSLKINVLVDSKILSIFI